MINANTTNNTKLRSIQILRCIACLGVFTVHFGQRMGLTGVLRSITDFGSYGVSLFLIISGYLAASSLIKNENVSISQYYAKRAIRILPLYYIIIAFYFISETIENIFFHHIPDDPLKLYWLRYFFLLNGFIEDESYFWNNIGITWTIPVFVFCYLIAPFICKHIKTYKNATFIIVPLCCLLYALRVLPFVPSCPIIVQTPSFLLGILAFQYEKDGHSDWLICTIAMLSAGCIVLHKYVPYPHGLLFVIILLSMNNGLSGSLFRCKALDIMDECSFTLYLAHGIVFCSIIDKVSIPLILRATVAVFGSLLLTILLHYLVEKPISKALRKRIIKQYNVTIQ